MKEIFSLQFILSALLAYVKCQLDTKQFVPYGISEGDVQLTGDDAHSPAIDFPFRFYNTQYNQIFVSKLMYFMSYDEILIIQQRV